MSRSTRLRLSNMLVVLILVIGIGLGIFGYLKHTSAPINPVLAGDGPRVTLMNFDVPIPLASLPDGWWQRSFMFTSAMKISFVHKDLINALRCETSASGSLFGRFTDVDLARFPHLEWSWLVEVPVVSNIVETLKEGDDHPARLLVELTGADLTAHQMELIWSNGALTAGEWKYIDNFPHYVVNGGDSRTNANSGVWHAERVNLLELYRTAFKRNDIPRLSNISIFCDTDNTGSRSVAYFGTIELSQ